MFASFTEMASADCGDLTETNEAVYSLQHYYTVFLQT